MVSKDADYDALGGLRRAPPKVIWLLLGNCTTKEVEAAIRSHAIQIDAFEKDANANIRWHWSNLPHSAGLDDGPRQIA